jgi:N,N'-diacetyllegionaminate synthase
MSFEIAGRRIGPGAPSFFIAEAGVNHNGSLDFARQLVIAAANAGADAVKFQTFRAAELVTTDAPKAEYQARNDGAGESQLAMLQRLELSEAAHHELLACCREHGVMFLSTPFEAASADFLERRGEEHHARTQGSSVDALHRHGHARGSGCRRGGDPRSR